MNDISFQNVYQASTQANFKLGERAVTPDGREWVYVRAQAAVSKGYLASPYSLAVANITSTENDSAGRTVFINKAGSFVDNNYFADGVGIVSGGTGKGQFFKVVSNTAGQLQLDPATPITTALDSTSDLTLFAVNYVTPSPTTSKIGKVVGCAQTTIATGSYGWLLTNGDGIVAQGPTNLLLEGAGFTSGGASAGLPIVSVSTNSALDAQVLGFCLVPGAASDPALVRFNIR